MKRIIILGIVIFLVIAGWSGAWLFASNEIRKAVVSLADADGETSPKVTCDKLVVGGYPFWFDVVCTGATVTSGDISANVAEVKATTLAYNPTQFLAVAKAPLTVTDAFTGSKSRLDWNSVEASARLTGWRIARISIVADTLVLNDTVAGDNLIGKASHAEIQVLDIPEQHDAAKGLAALALYAKADDVNAPGFQINDGRTSLEAEISGLSDDVRTYSDPAMLKRWQQAGGKIKLVALKGDDGDQFFNVVGTLGLDGQGKPEGQLTIGSKGLVERFGSTIPDQMRGLVLGAPGADGSYSQTINLRAGVIFSGLIPLGILPPLM